MDFKILDLLQISITDNACEFPVNTPFAVQAGDMCGIYQPT